MISPDDGGLSVAPISKHPLLRDQTYQILTQAIRENRFKPGQRIVESKLASQLNISRGPIRESIARLLAEGLLVITRDGLQVAPLPSPAQIVDNYAIRGVLQGLASRLAAQHANAQQLEQLRACLAEAKGSLHSQESEDFYHYNLKFHELVEEASGSESLRDAINHLRSPLYHRISHKMSQLFRIAVAHREHEEIFKAIERRDGPQAEALTKTHLENAKASLLEKFDGAA